MFKLFTALLACQLVGLIGSFATNMSVRTWYPLLTKPSFAPPTWIFPIVWPALYILMGIALFLVWQKLETDSRAQGAIRIFGIQLGLNLIWSFLFFSLRNPGLAFFEVIILWFAILWTILKFFPISKAAGVLLLPYLGWVGFATVLNYAFWQLNP